MNDYQNYKIVMIGSMNTGKTKISTRFISDLYIEKQQVTVGVQFLCKNIQINNQNIKVSIWDTAGSQKYKALSKLYYKNVSGIFFVYDIADEKSYLDIQAWMGLVNQNVNLDQVTVMVVGNKIDLQEYRQVCQDRAIEQYKKKYGIDCWQVSAKTGFNIKQAFEHLIHKIYQMQTKKKQKQKDDNLKLSVLQQLQIKKKKKKGKGKSCC